MICETLVWRDGRWSVPAFPSLDSERTLVLAFGTPGCQDDPRALLELTAAYPKARIIGCSTAGEMLGTEIADNTVVAAVCRFEHTRVEGVSATVRVTGSGDAGRAGLEIARKLWAPDLKGVLIFSDGLRVNGSDLLRGIRERLPPAVVVTGGLAADGDRFQRTWTLADRGPQAGQVCGVGLYGDRVQVLHSSCGGWEPFGPKRTITRAQANVLFDIDGLPAIDLYDQYLGELASGLPATALLFPLGVSAPGQERNLVVRTVLSVDRARRSMTFAGDVPQGSVVQLMRTSLERLVTGALTAAEQLAKRCGPGADGLTIAVSCVGRRLLMGERVADEVEVVAESMPPATKLVGYYAYGEFGPAPDGTPDFQNQTMTLTHIDE